MQTTVRSKIGSIIMSVVMVMALGLTLGMVGCSGGSSGEKAFVGVWALTSMEGEDGATEDDVAALEALGMSINLTMMEGGDAYLDFMGEVLAGTWVFKSGTEATVTMDGEAVPAKIDGKTLRLEQDDMVMVFEKTSDKPVVPEGSEEEIEVDDVDIVEEEDVDTDDAVAPETEEVTAVVGAEFGNEYATFTITGVEEDWAGAPAYQIKIENIWDQPIQVTTESGTFSVDGKMVSPVLFEEIQPGKYSEAAMWFSSDDVADQASLVNVEGAIEIMDDDYNTLATIMVYFPDAA